MRIVARTVLLSILSCVLLGLGSCKKKEDAAGAKEGIAAKAGSAQPPKELLVVIGMRSPEQTLDNGLALVRQFVPLPLSRAGLLDLFAQKAKLPRDLVEAIDIRRPFWLLGLNDRMIKEKDPAVIVLPLRSKKVFEEALGKQLQPAGTEGKLTTYKPKPGAVGQQEVKLWTTDRHVVVPSSAKALEVTAAYLTGHLFDQRPSHDLEVRVLMEHIIKDRGNELDQGFGRAMDRMRSNIKASPGPMDQQQVASATERTLRRYVDAVKSTRDLLIAADVDKERLVVTLSGEGLPRGRLQQLIKRQRVGEPFGYQLLPASSWLVLGDHGNPEASTEGKETWQPLLKEMTKKLKPALRERILSGADKAGDVFTGDFTVALHKPPSGAGLALSLVSRVADPKKAIEAMDDVGGALGQWLDAMMKESGRDDLKGISVDRKPLAHGGAKGEVFELKLDLSDEKRAQVDRMVGLPISFGIAFVDQYGFGTLGKGAEEQLRRLIDGAKQGKVGESLAENKAFEGARIAAKNRTGMLYLSPVDFVRWFEGTGHKEMEAIAAVVRDARVASAPSLDWGVDDKRSRMDFTLRLPMEQFTVFKPILQELQRRPGAGLLGGAKPGWRDL